MKKVLSVVVALAMVLAMAIPGFAMQIGTTVPTEHNVTVNYNDGGFVLVNGKICADGAQFKIDRFGEIDLGVYLENGYHLDSITVNGVDVTDEYVNGNLKIKDIVTDTYIDVTFEKCSDDPNDQCKKTDMEGTVYLGNEEKKEEIKGATLSFDFGSATATTDNDGRYKVDDISEGKHFVTISKDGEVLANTSFVIVMTDDNDKVVLTEAEDGTQVVLVPTGTEVIYLDFYIADNDGNGIPDQDPDKTDPGDPNSPDPVDPDGPGDVIYDPDDDGDGILDKDDPDHPNRDTDGDGIPDKYDPDDDNDGIPDKEDPDDDNDGIPDEQDPDHPNRDTDGDGIPDKEDKDDDNDGLPDGDEYDDDDFTDTDGDGTPDKDDDDDDNDGIPDAEDPDKDGDGHVDDYDGGDKDKDDDGVVIEIGGPKEDAPIIPIPDTLAEFFENPVAMGSVMALSLFLFIIILFKRKKDEEEEEQPAV